MSGFSNLEVIPLDEAKEELIALMDIDNRVMLTEWEEEFIIAIMDREHFSGKQKIVIKQLYNRIIEGVI